MEGPGCPWPVPRHHFFFPNDVSLCVSVSPFGDSHGISNIPIITVFVTVIGDQGLLLTESPNDGLHPLASLLNYGVYVVLLDTVLWHASQTTVWREHNINTHRETKKFTRPALLRYPVSVYHAAWNRTRNASEACLHKGVPRFCFLFLFFLS